MSYMPPPDRRASSGIGRPGDAAPTLVQYWRGDTRTEPGRRRSRWAGQAAFWMGLAAAVLLGVAVVTGLFPVVLASTALAFSVAALCFALIAIVVGISPGMGVAGAVLALLGNAVAWEWVFGSLA